jgi:hypothetical protein
MESIRELIEKRAYELFVARGGEHGYAYQDWLQAEKDVMDSLDKTTVAKIVSGTTEKKNAAAEPAEPKKTVKKSEEPVAVPLETAVKSVKKEVEPVEAPAKKKIVKKKGT